jgi:DNA invertase Pin-like site-specific DNA recombinase
MKPARRERQRQGIELAKQAGRYRGRRADPKRHAQVIALRKSGHSIAKTAVLAGCSCGQFIAWHAKPIQSHSS